MDGSTSSARIALARLCTGRAVGAIVGAVVASGLPASSAGAHGGAVASAGLTERQLHAFETRVLGPEHAAEHAAMRAAARRPVDPAADRRRRLQEVAAAGPPSEVGEWAGGPRVIVRNGRGDRSLSAIHALLLPTGKVLFFGPPVGSDSPRTPRVNESVAVLYDPVTGGFRDVAPPIDPRTGLRSNIYCGGAALMSDGRVLVTGGYLDFNENTAPNNKGLNHTWTFDPWTEDWVRHENLGGGTNAHSTAGGRWYPSQTLMPDGRTFIVGGITESGTQLNRSVEVFDPSRPLGQELDTLSGSVSGIRVGTDELIYPHTFWMPSGRGYVVGPANWISFFYPLPSSVFTQQNAPQPSLERTWSSGVLQPLERDSSRGRVTLIGGASHPGGDRNPGNNYQRGPATATTETFDEGANGWSSSSSLNVPRAHLNTVLLPDGRMVSVGGGAGGTNLYAVRSDRAERQVEIFDGNGWRLGPPQAESRAYHSTALLLPDGSVISAGDDNPAASDADPLRDTYEIYKPSYFFRGPRPEIRTAPASADYDATISVGTTATDIVKATLVAPGAATHAVDMSQRLINLPVSQKADRTGYDVRMPANRDVAVPGHYMLFIVDRDGRPSVASWIALGTQSRPGGGTQGEPVTPAPPPASPAPAPAGPPAPPVAVAPAAPVTAPARPRVTARLATMRLRVVRRRGRLVLRVGIGERGRARVLARLFRIRAEQRVSLGFWQRRVRFRSARTRAVTFRLTRAQRRRMHGDIRLRVVIRAQGATAGRRVRVVWFRLRRGGKVELISSRTTALTTESPPPAAVRLAGASRRP